MKITIDIPDKVADEFTLVAKSAGFSGARSLLQNYVREVILAARSEKAAQAAKQKAIADSADLDELIPPEKLPSGD